MAGVKSARLRVVQNHLASPYLNPTNDLSVNRTDENNFKYTVSSCGLSLKQRRFYEENGYIVIPDLVEEKLLDDSSSKFKDLCEERIPKGQISLVKDISLAQADAKGEYLYNKAQDLIYDDTFEQYMLHPKILDVVSCFIGPNIKAIKMFINKPPDSGKLTSRHPPHQDLYYFPFRPANRMVAAWTAIDRTTINNGCLVVAPGTHKGKLHPHDYPKTKDGLNNIGFHGVKGFDDDEFVPLQMQKGDTVFFHPLLVHGSGYNKTTGFRKALSCHYAASECYFIDIEGTIQHKIGEEIKRIAKIKGVDPDLKNIWRYKMRLARGLEKTLL